MGFIDSSVVAVNNGLTEFFNFSHTSVGSPSWIRPDNPADAFIGSLKMGYNWATLWFI